MGNWLNRTDLPTKFEELKIQHKSDAIRLALLEIYGGIWIDATVLQVRPFAQILGDHPAERRFFLTLRGKATRNLGIDKYERRADWTYYHIENWLFAAPPKDPLFVRTRACVNAIMDGGHDWTNLNETGQFSDLQIEMFRPLDLWAWLSTHACMYKVISEDFAMTHWWTDPKKVEFRDPAQGLVSTWLWESWTQMRNDLFFSVNQGLVKVFMNDSTGLLKFYGDYRKRLVEPVTPHDLWCGNNSMHVMLSDLGLLNASRC